MLAFEPSTGDNLFLELTAESNDLILIGAITFWYAGSSFRAVGMTARASMLHCDGSLTN
uniref:Cl31817_1 n=1 Tax=Arundo donax TaxID=35708 RepID=A0A0A9F1A2_ARUDO